MWVVVGGGGGGMRANTETGRSSARAGAFYNHVNKMYLVDLGPRVDQSALYRVNKASLSGGEILVSVRDTCGLERSRLRLT